VDVKCNWLSEGQPGKADGRGELAVPTAYNKLERTQQVLKVSEEVVTLRSESNRVLKPRTLARARAEIASCNGGPPRSTTPRRSPSSHSWTIRRRTTSSFTPWVLHRMTGLRPCNAVAFEPRSRHTLKRPALTIHFISYSDCAFAHIKPLKATADCGALRTISQSCKWSGGGAIPRRFIL